VIQPLLAPAAALAGDVPVGGALQLRLPHPAGPGDWAAHRDEPFGRLAAIDIGSNSIHMIVVAPQTSGAYRVLGREREMVRLGKTGLGEGVLSEAAIANGLEALIRITTLARLKGADRVVAVATSAVREAANGRDFLARVKAQTGLEVQLLTGAEEGRLIFRAVREVVDLGPGTAAVIDVGGGSTEWITAQAGELAGVGSLPLGSLRCAAQLKGDPPRPASIARLRAAIRARLAEELPRDLAAPPLARLVATSGTALCCADLVDLFAGRKEAATGLREVRTKDLAQLVARLRKLTRREVAELPPVGGPRSDSLMAGAVLLQELVSHAGVDRFQVCDRALRDGLVLAALGQPIPAALQPGDLRRRQVLQLAEQAQSVLRHSLQTARLAVRLFDVTASLHGFGAREREWLEYAALLHDIGQLSLADPLPSGATVLATPWVAAEVAARGAEVVRETGVLDRVARVLEAQCRPYLAGADGSDPDSAEPTSESERRAAAILRVANDFEDLRTAEPGPSPHVRALARIRRGIGDPYDPQAVESLTRLFGAE